MVLALSSADEDSPRATFSPPPLQKKQQAVSAPPIFFDLGYDVPNILSRSILIVKILTRQTQKIDLSLKHSLTNLPSKTPYQHHPNQTHSASILTYILEWAASLRSWTTTTSQLTRRSTITNTHRCIALKMNCWGISHKLGSGPEIRMDLAPFRISSSATMTRKKMQFLMQSPLIL